MSKPYEMRLSGSGGQGVILAAVILAEAALIAGKHTAQSQSYGPEARGGICKSETLISNDPIGFPKVQEPDFVLALTQESLDKYSQGVSDVCVVMADASLEVPAHLNPKNVVSVPILKTAIEDLGKPITGNIVALGAINAALELVKHEELEEAVAANVPKSMTELNLKALAMGRDLVSPENKHPANMGA